jgi:hypothetical protein
MSRRAFLAALPLPLAAGITAAALRQDGHPDPRPGIDARDVLGPGDLEGYDAEVRATFEMVRQMPRVADGIRCYCGCADRAGMRSLLSCFGPGGMAKDCEVCQGEARLAHRRWREGQSLAQIRRAITARYA